MVNVSDIVANLGKRRQSFSGDGVAKILLNIHSDFDGIKRVQAVLSQRAAFGHT